MTADLGDDRSQEQFDANVRFIEQLSGQLIATVIAEFEADAGDAAKQVQAKRWRADQVLSQLVDVYKQEQRRQPGRATAGSRCVTPTLPSAHGEQPMTAEASSLTPLS